MQFCVVLCDLPCLLAIIVQYKPPEQRNENNDTKKFTTIQNGDVRKYLMRYAQYGVIVIRRGVVQWWQPKGLPETEHNSDKKNGNSSLLFRINIERAQSRVL